MSLASSLSKLAFCQRLARTPATFLRLVLRSKAAARRGASPTPAQKNERAAYALNLPNAPNTTVLRTYAGDTTLLQYWGVDWETGESFDSSWSRGAPTSIPGNTYVPGFIQALEGQTSGSQVLVVIPPALGYGEVGASDHELAGKTLVFVIDVLATEHAPAPAQ